MRNYNVFMLILSVFLLTGCDEEPNLSYILDSYLWNQATYNFRNSEFQPKKPRFLVAGPVMNVDSDGNQEIVYMMKGMDGG